MNRERWQQVDRVFAAALERGPEDRGAFLAQACAGDEELRREVESLLAHDPAEGFLERPVSGAAARLILETTPRLVAGQSVGPYVIEKSIGAGGMGEIYLAHDRRLNRHVALKLLAEHLAEDDQRLGRFRQEAMAASALNHPNILTIYEIGASENWDFIATEFIQGQTLRERLQGGPLPLADIANIATQIAGALAAAHHAGIVHRDIKPENVMVRPDGLVKVLDFGIAKYPASERLTAAAESMVDTVQGVVVGTATYMSPEQARGLEVDGRTDLWSLGVVLYEMVTCALPFSGATTADRIAAILEREPQPLGGLRRGVPAELERTVRRLLTKDRDQRYQNAADLIADLHRLRARLGEPSQSGLTWMARPRWTPWLRSRAGAALTAVLLLLVGGGLWWAEQHGAAGAPIDSVAVLPLVNAGGSGEMDYLSDGITESLIDSLSRISNLKVLSRNSVFHYKGQEIDARTVGSSLGVRAVLTGRVERRGEDLSVHVELVDTRDGSHLWGERYDRKLADLLGVQNEISRQIGQRLRLRLSGEERRRVALHGTRNAEAYQSYLKGRFYWHKTVPEEYLKCREHFERAVELDPSYALAWSGMTSCYGYGTAYGFIDPKEGWPKMEAALARALALDPSIPETHNGVAALHWYYHRDLTAAERSFRRAIELDPNYPNTHNHYGHYLVLTGRPREGLAQIRKGLALDPTTLRFHFNVGRMLYYTRQYQKAIAHLRESLELDQNDVLTHETLGFAYEAVGHHEPALAEFRLELVLSRDDELVEILDRTYKASGYWAAMRAVAAKRLERLNLKQARGAYVPPIEYVRLYVRLGDREQAFAWLARADGERDRLIYDIEGDPLYDSLRDDPRFRRVREHLGLGPQRRDRAAIT
ncbi:MAG TPA: protein kinase [Acidobacteriota bacterium]